MASSSTKKTASSNEQKLYELHLISGVVVIFSLAIIAFFRRPQNLKLFILYQIPLLGCQYTIEKSGRPKYKWDNVGQYNKLVNSGMDLNQPGLTEYLFDIIYVSWILDALTIIIGSLKVWYLFLIVPGFAAFKLSGFIKAFFPKSDSSKPVSAPTEKNEKSKRQQKLEKNGRRKIIR